MGFPRKADTSNGRSSRSVFLLVFLGVFVIAACAGDGEQQGDGDSPTTSVTGDSTTVTGDSSEPPTDNGDALPTVRLQGIEAGLASIAPTVIQEQGFDESNGFAGEITFPSFDAHDQDFLQERADISSTDLMNVAIWRNQGFDVVAFYPELAFTIGVVVREDSPYETMEDLVGESVGHFGSSSGASLTMSTMMDEFYDLNFFDDFELVESGPAALPDLLSQEQVEAIVTFDPHVSRAIVEIPGRVLYDPGDDWQSRTGGGLWITTLVARQSWLTENPDLAYRVRDAYVAAFEYITENPEILAEEPYLSLMGLEQAGEEVLDLFIRRVRDEKMYWINTWTDTDREAGEEFVDLMASQGLAIDENPGGLSVNLEELLGARD